MHEFALFVQKEIKKNWVQFSKIEGVFPVSIFRVLVSSHFLVKSHLFHCIIYRIHLWVLESVVPILQTCLPLTWRWHGDWAWALRKEKAPTTCSCHIHLACKGKSYVVCTYFNPLSTLLSFQIFLWLTSYKISDQVAWWKLGTYSPTGDRASGALHLPAPPDRALPGSLCLAQLHLDGETHIWWMCVC